MASHSDLPSPQLSRSSSTSSSKRPKSPLTLDLSDLPALIQPSPPSNTLIITNLYDASIFHPKNIQTIRDLINTHAPIHTFAPLKSFRRIIVSFFDEEAAMSIRQQLDGTHLMGCPTRVFFGEPTPLNFADQHLELPKSDKLFFISPPPSPPHGWEMRNEDPPNKLVHAEDLATALAKLRASNDASLDEMQMPSPVTDDGNNNNNNKADGSSEFRTRKRGSSTVIYHPEDHGDSPNLPAIAIQDTTMQFESSPGDLSPMEGVEPNRLAFLRTERPPMDLAHAT